MQLENNVWVWISTKLLYFYHYIFQKYKINKTTKTEYFYLTFRVSAMFHCHEEKLLIIYILLLLSYIERENYSYGSR